MRKAFAITLFKKGGGLIFEGGLIFRRLQYNPVIPSRICSSAHCKNKLVVLPQSGYRGCRQTGEVPFWY